MRPRTWIETEDPDKLVAYATLYNVMSTLVKLMAPFTPFLAESIYQNLVRGLDPSAPESVHMCDWPGYREDLIDKGLEESMSYVREISEAAANARQKGGRKLRWPVSRIIIASDEQLDLRDLLHVLRTQTNSKEVIILPPGEKPEMNLEISVVQKKIGPVFKGESRDVVEALTSMNPKEVKRIIESGEPLEWKGRSYMITEEMVEFREIPPANLIPAEFSKGTVYVDVSLTDELRAEGYAREIIRRIQDMRKDLDLKVDEMIRVSVALNSNEVVDLVSGWRDYISSEVRATLLRIGNDLDLEGELTKDWEVDGVKIRVSVARA